jgi:hypothetical protein
VDTQRVSIWNEYHKRCRKWKQQLLELGIQILLLDKSNGANIVFSMLLFQTSPHILVTLREILKLKVSKAFRNKTIMIENDAIKNAPLLSMLILTELSLERYQTCETEF